MLIVFKSIISQTHAYINCILCLAQKKEGNIYQKKNINQLFIQESVVS